MSDRHFVPNLTNPSGRVTGWPVVEVYGPEDPKPVHFRCEPEPEPDPFPGYVICGWCGGRGCRDCDYAGRILALATVESPETWARPDGYDGPCPECGSTTCQGYYKPDGNHFLAF